MKRTKKTAKRAEVEIAALMAGVEKRAIEDLLQSVVARSRDLERQRVAGWLLGEAIQAAEKGDAKLAREIEKLARLVRANAIELGKGGEA